MSDTQEWVCRDAPGYSKGTRVSYLGGVYEATRDIEPGLTTNAPPYSGFWTTIEPALTPREQWEKMIKKEAESLCVDHGTGTAADYIEGVRATFEAIGRAYVAQGGK